MKCFCCNCELIQTKEPNVSVCRNPKCQFDGYHFPDVVWERLSYTKRLKNAYIRLGMLFLEYFDIQKCGYSEAEHAEKRKKLRETIVNLLREKEQQ